MRLHVLVTNIQAINVKAMLRLFVFPLQLCVSGNNLLNICKLIFKISRSESNDIFFKNNSIIGQDDLFDWFIIL